MQYCVLIYLPVKYMYGVSLYDIPSFMLNYDTFAIVLICT